MCRAARPSPCAPLCPPRRRFGGIDGGAWTWLGKPTVTSSSQDDPTHPFFYLSAWGWNSGGAVGNLFSNYGKGEPLDTAPFYKLRGSEKYAYFGSASGFAEWAGRGSVLATRLLDALP